MKKILLLTAAVSLSQISFAQETTEQETLFNKKIDGRNIGFMVSPGVSFTQVAGESAAFYQIRAGVVLWDKLTVGGFYANTFYELRPAYLLVDFPNANLDVYAAGGFIEYTVLSGKLFHLTIPVAIGSLEMEGDDYDRFNDVDGEKRTFYIEPAVQAELNLHKYARLHAGLGYRLMGNSSNSGASIPEAGNEVTFQVGLKLGMFRIKN
jgi:extradiol dioxygenase family protein